MLKVKNTLSTAMNIAWRSMSQGFGSNRQFNPGNPLPVGGDDPLKMGPRINQYRVGQNLNITPRVEVGAMPFELLRRMGDASDLVRICINARKEQIAGLEWDIVPEDPEDDNEWEQDIKIEKEFWKYPDKINDFQSWISQIVEEVMVTDSLSLYRRLDKKGNLYAVEQIDGTTIKPLVDMAGRTPLPPHSAYQQILYGRVNGEYTMNELIYAPKNKRIWNKYGMSPIEMVIVKVNLALKRDDFYMRYYTKGSMPDAGIYQTDANWTPEQLNSFQVLWNDMMSGNIDNRMSLRFVPKGTYTQTKEWKFETSFDEWLARIVANAFNVSPMMFTKMINRASGGLQENQQSETGLKPLVMFLEKIITRIIQIDRNKPHLRIIFKNNKAEDAKIEITKNTEYVKAGIYSIDEVRQAEGKKALGIPNMIISGGAGPVFLTSEVIEQAIKNLTNPQAVGSISDEVNGSEVKNSKHKEMAGTNNDDNPKEPDEET